MLFEWHGILQFISQSGLSFDSVFFFTVHCYFMAILKSPADTNAGQSHRFNHRIKNLYCYNLKSLIYNNFQFNFPHYTPAKVKFPHLGRPYKSKSNSSLPRHRKCSQMPGVCWGGVTGGGVAVSIWTVHNIQLFFQRFELNMSNSRKLRNPRNHLKVVIQKLLHDGLKGPKGIYKFTKLYLSFDIPALLWNHRHFGRFHRFYGFCELDMPLTWIFLYLKTIDQTIDSSQ